ncbi:MAG TPA: flavin reductase family protein [Candidatus Polarisedimenticolia bacterium]|nr:flavin reductase family protein [Candidatus Polarisedimenticolia bacterium]
MIGPQLFKDVMKLWASGVSVAVTPSGRGVQAITVSSFTSVSLTPPLILVCIELESRSHEGIVGAGCFSVNVLAEGMNEISDMAAGRRGPEGHALPGVGWRIEKTGAPVLEDALAWVDCTVAARHDGGDHSIFVGRVEAAGAADGAPLLWYDRGYARLARPD